MKTMRIAGRLLGVVTVAAVVTAAEPRALPKVVDFGDKH